jgi:pyridoxamine 5'-phosphate oxidase
MTPAEMRREYSKASLNEADVSPDPIRQFLIWFEQVMMAQVVEPNAMILATSTPDGRPSARVVLVKGIDERGFSFFTNRESRKGLEIEENPHAALVFFWHELERQVRIEGRAHRVSDEESDRYFRTRPTGSRLAAWASPQSQVISDRESLAHRLAEVAERFEGIEVPRPPHWGGYLVVPEIIEFWQGGENRLHDRIRYQRMPHGEWAVERLAP